MRPTNVTPELEPVEDGHSTRNIDREALMDFSDSSYSTDSSDPEVCQKWTTSPPSSPIPASFLHPYPEGMSSLTRSSAEGRRNKIFNDMVHPHLELPDICYRIINTPEFQRLRNLKQLGLCYHVYPSACHNRFEHCIGVSFLAGKYGKMLQKNQPDLDITEQDILCLFIAGLCHDLGHGPFSHAWEHFLKKYVNDYSHEDASIRILDHLLQANNLMPMWENLGLTLSDLTFIKELILGHPIPIRSNGLSNGVCKFQGRPPNKHFLYQIVSNDVTKVDVDKFDYILRDCKQLNISTAFDYERVLDNSRVFFLGGELNETDVEAVTDRDRVTENTVTTIAYRKKISGTLEDLFRGRSSLHAKAYQHRVTMIVEQMVMDGLHAAEPYFRVPSGSDPKKTLRLSNAHTDIGAFLKLTDSVFEQIVNWGNGGDRAQVIFENVLKRHLYKSLGYLKEPVNKNLTEELRTLEPYLILVKTNINYGKGKENPLNSALFYEKGRPDILFRQTFQPPLVEGRCFVVIRPTYALPPSTEVKAEVDIERQVRMILQTYNQRLELE